MTRIRHTHKQPRLSLANVIETPRETATRAARDLGTCVYAVRTPDRLVKVGYTTDLNMRIRQYGSKWADVLLALPADMDYEKALHARFKPYRARGHEYYFPVVEIMDWINDERSLMHVGPVAI